MTFPLVLFTVLMVAGEPQPVARVGEVISGSPAARAGVVAGDLVTAVDGTPVRTWPDLEDALMAGAGGVTLAVDRGGGAMSLRLEPDAGPRYAYRLGLDNTAPDTIVGVDHPASPAAIAGLVTGDRVTAVDGEVVTDFVDLTLRLDLAETAVTLTLLRGETESTARVAPSEGWAEPTASDDRVWRRWGIADGQVIIGGVSEGSAAEAAGLAAGDRLLRVGDRDVASWTDITRGVQTAAQGSGETIQTVPIDIMWRRAGEVRTVTAHPAVDHSPDQNAIFRYRPLLGVSPRAGSVLPEQIARPYPITEAIPRAWNETVSLGTRMVELLVMMFTREAAAEKLLGGPIAVFATLHAAASAGMFALVRQTGFISLSLGIINLVPVPIFDGGQMVMNAAEWLRGRPLPLILRERVQQVGVIFVLVLMFAVVVNDLYRTFGPG